MGDASRTLLDGMERLIGVLLDLSRTRCLEDIQVLVPRAARELMGADGATFVLRDGDQCYYAGEDAIAPLWKGSRFPMSACISGWAMLNGESAVIEDISVDDRFPTDVYRPTFVKSLAMVPIRASAPIGAIGAYWASPHVPSEAELKLIQALAHSTSIAMENVQSQAALERLQRVEAVGRRAAGRIAHDFNNELSVILSYSQLIHADQNPGDRYYADIEEIAQAGGRAHALARQLLAFSRQQALDLELLDLAEIGNRVDDEEDAPTSLPAAVHTERGNETILLVDADDSVRSVACQILRRNGYVVLEAANAGEALLIAEQHTATIHLLLTDVVLPRLGGRQIAERITQMRPDIRVLFISGDIDGAVLRHGVLESNVSYLQKPITPASLTRKVRQVLDP